jgi:haloalkane dehalogenase
MATNNYHRWGDKDKPIVRLLAAGLRGIPDASPAANAALEQETMDRHSLVSALACLSASLSLACAAQDPQSSKPSSGSAADGGGPTCVPLPTAFPFEDQYLAVTPPGLPTARMRYVEAGSGERLFVLLHGIPTSAYLWRNVIPELASHGRVVALDLVGFGHSERPPTLERLSNATQVAYLNAFLDKRAKGSMNLVVHDLGSVVGLTWASQHAARVEGLVMLESLIPGLWPLQISDSPSRCTAAGFPPDHPVCWFAFVASADGERATVEDNFFLESIPQTLTCPPSEAAMRVYREPFPDAESRRHLLDGPHSVFRIDGLPLPAPKFGADASQVDDYVAWLQTSTVPKLIVYADAGFLISQARAESARHLMPNTRIASIGARRSGTHFLQEESPQVIAQSIVDWLRAR